MLNKTAAAVAFLAANAWLLASFGGLINASGRIGTGFYSDSIGRANAYLVNGVISAACLFATPAIMQSGNVVLLFLSVGVAYWQYGGGLDPVGRRGCRDRWRDRDDVDGRSPR